MAVYTLLRVSIFRRYVGCIFRPLLEAFALPSVGKGFVRPYASSFHYVHSHRYKGSRYRAMSLSKFTRALSRIYHGLSSVGLGGFFRAVKAVPAVFFYLLSRVVRCMFSRARTYHAVVARLARPRGVLFPSRPRFFFYMFSGLLFAVRRRLVSRSVL